MKNALKALEYFWYYIFNFGKLRKFSGYEKSVKKVLQKREIERMILSKKIYRFLLKQIDWKSDNSKYIPAKRKSNAAYKKLVMAKFSKDLLRLDMYINHKVEVCIR